MHGEISNQLAMHYRNRMFRWALYLFALFLLWGGITAALIMQGGTDQSAAKADTAIILGAAVRGAEPSPVFAERIRHGITLYKSGRVKYLLFTGGKGDGARWAESEVGRNMALAAGVPATAIFTEARSHTTLENITEAKRVMQREGLVDAIIVSDPLHLYRAGLMAKDNGIIATSSPTPTTRYRSFSTKADFLAREIFFTNVYWLWGG